MPSPQESKPQSQKPAQDMSPRELMDAAMQGMVMELIQLRRTLWLVCKQVGPVAVDESKVHPLWRMKATRLDTGAMHLQAIQLPEPTAEQLAQLAETLNGSKTPLADALPGTELKEHPPAYLAFLLMPTIQQREDGQWVDSVLMQRPPGDNN